MRYLICVNSLKNTKLRFLFHRVFGFGSGIHKVSGGSETFFFAGMQ